MFHKLRLTKLEKQSLQAIGISAFAFGCVLLGSAESHAQLSGDGFGDLLTTSPAEAVVDELEVIPGAVTAIAPVAVAAGVYNLTMHPAKKFVYS